MTKSASSVISQQDIQNHMPPHSHFGVHLISMATEEDFGANKNGDSTSRNALDKYHNTFEKYGSVFREHKNRCAKTQGIGQVKLARYNAAQGRGELLIWVDKDKAPDMHKKAKEDKELSWSMSMRLPFDRCSCCDKKSKTVAEYCGHLKRAMLKYVPEFRKIAYARNEDDIKLFDISEVENRAERIATYLKYFGTDDMAKAASSDIIIPGAEWGSYQHADLANVVEFDPWHRLTLSKLAAAVDYVRSATPIELQGLAATAPKATGADWRAAARADFRDIAGALAKKAMILPFGEFVSMIESKPLADIEADSDFKKVEACELPGLIDSMTESESCGCGPELSNMVSPDDCGGLFSAAKDSIDNMVETVGDNLGMTPQPVRERVITISIKSASLKTSETVEQSFYKSAATAYGCYLVKAAHLALETPNICERTLLRGIAAMLLVSSEENTGHQ